MRKRGVSPLIATVLIIAVTVSVAVFFMNFTTGFMRERTIDVEETTKQQLFCTSGINFDFECNCIDNNWDGYAESCSYDISNNGDLIFSKGILVRAISSDGRSENSENSAVINPLGILFSNMDLNIARKVPMKLEILVLAVKKGSTGEEFNCGSLARLKKVCTVTMPNT